MWLWLWILLKAMAFLRSNWCVTESTKWRGKTSGSSPKTELENPSPLPSATCVWHKMCDGTPVKRETSLGRAVPVGNRHTAFQFNEAVRLVDVLLVPYYCVCVSTEVVLLPSLPRRTADASALVLPWIPAPLQTQGRSLPRPCRCGVLSVWKHQLHYAFSIPVTSCCQSA